MRLKFNKFGLVSDPRGGHCTYTHEGRQLLGEVKGVVLKQGYANHLLLDVRFFNGESWPVQPLAVAVEMLERDCETNEFTIADMQFQDYLKRTGTTEEQVLADAMQWCDSQD